MKKIKFRGVTSEGKVITSCGVRFDDDSPRLLVKDGFTAWQKILADSFAQLVGYDADGKEVYEGDKLKHVDDENYNAIARFETFIGVKTGTIQNLYDCHSEKIFHAQNSKFWKLKG